MRASVFLGGGGVGACLTSKSVFGGQSSSVVGTCCNREVRIMASRHPLRGPVEQGKRGWHSPIWCWDLSEPRRTGICHPLGLVGTTSSSRRIQRLLVTHGMEACNTVSPPMVAVLEGFRMHLNVRPIVGALRHAVTRHGFTLSRKQVLIDRGRLM